MTDQCQLFTSEFPRADIQRMLSLDILHQLIKGGFKDHLVDWVEKYLFHTHSKSSAEKILDNIDQRYVACPLLPRIDLIKFQDCSCCPICWAATFSPRPTL